MGTFFPKVALQMQSLPQSSWGNLSSLLNGYLCWEDFALLKCALYIKMKLSLLGGALTWFDTQCQQPLQKTDLYCIYSFRDKSL